MYLRFVVKLFLGNRSGVLLLLPVLIALYVLLNAFWPHHEMELETNFGFWGTLSIEQNWITRIFASALVFSNAILLNLIFNRNGFMEKNSFLLALLYTIGHSYFYSFYFLSGAGIATAFLIFSIYQLYQLDQNEDGRTRTFNAGFLIGVGVTFHPVFGIVFPFLLAMIWILRPVILRETFLVTTGFIIPIIYCFLYGWITKTSIWDGSFSGASKEVFYIDFIVFSSVFIMLGLLSLRPLFKKMQQSSIRLKKLFRMNALIFLAATAISLLDFTLNRRLETAVFMLVVVALTVPFSFNLKKPGLISVSLFYILLIFSVSKFFLAFD